jgi:tRNA (adenine37-N6)-methyltransferase
LAQREIKLSTSLCLQAIGVIHSPLSQKFAVPRQARLAPTLKAEIELFAPWNQSAWYEDCEGMSHLWILTYLHQQKAAGINPKVRPPRLGGNKSISVFATRSPERPNPIGMTLVDLLSIDKERGRIIIANHDFVDATPVIDIKPYHPSADQISGDSHLGWIETSEHESFEVQWREEVMQRLTLHQRQTIQELLRFDITPRYHQPGRDYWFEFESWDIGVQKKDLVFLRSLILK